MLYIPQSMKPCSKCGEWKLNSRKCFARNGGGTLRPDCKACLSVRRASDYIKNREYCMEKSRQRHHANKEDCNAKSREYYQANRERLSAINREYRQTHREHISQLNRQYYCANRERLAESNRRYRLSRKEHYIKYCRQYYYANKDSLLQRRHQYYQSRKDHFAKLSAARRLTPEGRMRERIHHAKRRAQKRYSGATHSVADIRQQYDAQLGRCYYCQSEVGDKYHVDHYIPLSKGGSNGPENIVIACPACNLRKHNKMPDEFMAILEAEKVKGE